MNRRNFLAGAGASAFTILKPEQVRGAAPERIRVGVVGCGGRGTQAAEDTLVGNPAVEIVAMGDAFEDRLETSIRQLREGRRTAKMADRVKVDAEHRFTGLDAFKKVLASEVDYVILATPPGYRPEHFEAAVAAKKHIFCEKPFATDGVGLRRFMEAAKKSEEMKLSVKSGAQRRSQKVYLDAYKRVKDGQIGDIVALNAYWVGRPVLFFQGRNWRGPQGKRDPKWSDMEFQNRNWYSFVWICGDQIVEQHLHNIDVCNWFMGKHPVKAVASGGTAWRPKDEMYGNIYDHVAADFVYDNGVHMSSYCRQYPQPLAENISELIVGTKGRIDTNTQEYRRTPDNPYVTEHQDLVNSITGAGPYLNEAMAVAESTATCIMGREAAYSGQEVTWEMVMNSKQDLVPKTMTMDASIPVPPLPVPGQYKFS
jgi:predicted dehydrogenase